MVCESISLVKLHYEFKIILRLILNNFTALPNKMSYKTHYHPLWGYKLFSFNSEMSFKRLVFLNTEVKNFYKQYSQCYKKKKFSKESCFIVKGTQLTTFFLWRKVKYLFMLISVISSYYLQIWLTQLNLILMFLYVFTKPAVTLVIMSALQKHYWLSNLMIKSILGSQLLNRGRIPKLCRYLLGSY